MLLHNNNFTRRCVSTPLCRIYTRPLQQAQVCLQEAETPFRFPQPPLFQGQCAFTHLSLDVGEQRAGPYPEEVGSQPLVPQFLLYQREPCKGFLCRTDASCRLKAYLRRRGEKPLSNMSPRLESHFPSQQRDLFQQNLT